tara:strand:- start:124 stop:729 length:606 start_codon:yes stop_codon:yes gene_type:complete
LFGSASIVPTQNQQQLHDSNHGPVSKDLLFLIWLLMRLARNYCDRDNGSGSPPLIPAQVFHFLSGILSGITNKRDIEFLRKRAGHLWSKGRYLGAQFNGYLTDGYWLTLATHANRMAQRLSKGLAAIEGVELIYPTDINEVFVQMPDAVVIRLQEAGAHFYPWICPGLPAQSKVYRFITSWSTAEDEVDQLLSLARIHNPV